jgi:succinate-semialdehyde dehydrogenase/glutarate-semialdehyde dehydrogenase
MLPTRSENMTYYGWSANICLFIQFKDPSLVDNRCFIGGKWVSASNGATFPVHDPVDDKPVVQVPDLSLSEFKNSLTEAQKAFQIYKKTPHRSRRFMLRKWSDLIKAHRDDLAALCTLELGKPFTESLVTVDYGISFLDWFETLAEHTTGETIPANRAGTRVITVKEPQGVVVAITPWNSPIAMITRKVGAAIAAGNTVVCKPAPETPLCAFALAKLFERAGFPAGVLNIVTCSPSSTQEIGEELCRNKIVKHLSFTGSTAVGKILNQQCGAYLKKTSMELGGNAPFIVFEDADLEKAVEGCVSSKFRSSGQTCICANRVFVHEDVIDKFAELLKKRVGEVIKVGGVWDKAANFGPLYAGKGVEKVVRHVEDAKGKGAKVVLGGELDKQYGPNFYPPTILTGVSRESVFLQEETFGPVAALVPFKTEEEVIGMANDVDVGLAGYFYTENIGRLWRVAEALEVGMVGARVGLISACEQPFGGIKESGVGGREGSRWALDEYLNIKSITVGGI